MKRRTLWSVLLLLVVSIAGCASGETHGSVAERIPPVPAGMGRIVFYRPSAMAGGLKPPIQVNDMTVGKSISKGFLFIDREPGEYVISTSTLVEHRLGFQLAADTTRYVKLRSSVGLVAGHIIPELVMAEQAQRDLPSMKYIGDSSLLLPAR